MNTAGYRKKQDVRKYYKQHTGQLILRHIDALQKYTKDLIYTIEFRPLENYM